MKWNRRTEPSRLSQLAFTREILYTLPLQRKRQGTRPAPRDQLTISTGSSISVDMSSPTGTFINICLYVNGGRS